MNLHTAQRVCVLAALALTSAKAVAQEGQPPSTPPPPVIVSVDVHAPRVIDRYNTQSIYQGPGNQSVTIVSGLYWTGWKGAYATIGLSNAGSPMPWSEGGPNLLDVNSGAILRQGNWCVANASSQNQCSMPTSAYTYLPWQTKTLQALATGLAHWTTGATSVLQAAATGTW